MLQHDLSMERKLNIRDDKKKRSQKKKNSQSMLFVASTFLSSYFCCDPNTLRVCVTSFHSSGLRSFVSLAQLVRENYGH